jgi:putative nucleotidyltransferase with HDIG domain
MRQEQLEQFRQWFDDYVAGFYGDDEYINANIRLKDEHSRRVCEEMAYLAGELGLGENQRRIADTVALFHDIGRFRQFEEYQTYHDPRSLNHCILGLEVLAEYDVLAGVEAGEREMIEKAIEYHGLKELPAGLDGDCLLYSRMIRDADKVDIFYVVIVNYEVYEADPESFKLEVELPDEPWYSPEVFGAVLDGQRIDYGKLATWNDMKLCQLSWVYDVNFAATLKRIKEKKCLEKIFDFLPSDGDIERVKGKIFGYVDSKINQGF